MRPMNAHESPPVNTFHVLRALVDRTTCKPGWRFSFDDDDEGLRLVIFIPVQDSRGKDLRGVHHYFPVPVTTWNEKSWRRWVFECCRKVEDHELGEWFLVGDERPFAPCHSPGYDPYTIRELSTEEEVQINQRGVREP